MREREPQKNQPLINYCQVSGFIIVIKQPVLQNKYYPHNTKLFEVLLSIKRQLNKTQTHTRTQMQIK